MRSTGYFDVKAGTTLSASQCIVTGHGKEEHRAFYVVDAGNENTPPKFRFRLEGQRYTKLGIWISDRKLWCCFL